MARFRSSEARRLADTARRHADSRIDRLWARSAARLRPFHRVPWHGSPRVALITVNFSTTRYLKLLLLTLAEQQRLEVLDRIIVVDNGSRDGGRAFLNQLGAEGVVHLVERNHFLDHARGMRAGVRALDRVDHQADVRANIILFCDSDVVFRRPDSLGRLVDVMVASDAALAGEVRSGTNPRPDIQASFFAVRRDVFALPDVAPIHNDGSPAYELQRSIWDAGLGVADFPSNRGGFILHRGRSGVAAAATHRPGHPYASVRNRAPHFMGVRDGPAAWDRIATVHAAYTAPAAERALLDLLTGRLGRRAP